MYTTYKTNRLRNAAAPKNVYVPNSDKIAAMVRKLEDAKNTK